MMRLLSNKKGVTLIELVVVIAILGILMMLIVPRIGVYQASAARQTCLANQRTLASSQAIYFANKGQTATTVAQLQAEKIVDKVICPSANAGLTGDLSYAVDAADSYVWRCLIDPTNHVEQPVTSPNPTSTP